MNRRRFLATGGALLAGASGVRAVAQTVPEPSSRLAAVHSASVRPTADRLNSPVVLRMLDTGVCHLTGEQDAAKAWAALFSADDAVALKVNTSAGPSLSTSKTLVECIVERLADVGVKRDNMVIYDRTDGMLAACGYTLNTGAGLKCGGIEGHWDARQIRQGAFRGQLPVILNYVSAIINVPILKDAGGAGVTISMKNHFGTISNPQECHGNGCDPYIADVNAIPQIRDKQRLIVCDATSACFEGGPGADPRYVWQPNLLLIGKDPVALDSYGAKLIDEKRAQQGLPSLAAAGRAPRQLASAAARSLGTDDPAKVDLLKVSI